VPQRAPPAIDMAIDHRPPHRERSRIRWCHHDRLLRWIEGRDNGLGIKEALNKPSLGRCA